MKRDFREAMALRRSRYGLSDKISLTDKQIEEIIDFAVLNVPSAFNSQSARVVLLLGDNHARLWSIVKETLRKMVPAEAFPKTENKIDTQFASGYGTILFFEDQSVVEGLQAQFPSYHDNFPLWSLQSSGMLQFTIWTMLEDAGLGASLQHYNPIIDAQVVAAWKIDPKWKLWSQMPFGAPTDTPVEKTFLPLEERVKVFK